MEDLKARAERDDPTAMYVLGAYHGSGLGRINGLAHDERKAFELYERAAKTGDVEAAYTL